MPIPRRPAPQRALPFLLLGAALALSACGDGEVARTGDAAAVPAAPLVSAPPPHSLSPAPSPEVAEPEPEPAQEPEASAEVTSPPPADPSPAPEPTPEAAAPTGSPEVAAAAAPRPARSKLALPVGPATDAPAPRTSGGLSAVAWDSRPLPTGTCSGGRAQPPVFGDLDGDGREEAALAVECPGDSPDAALLFRGTATSVVLVGNALPASEAAQVRAVQFRDGHLVVAALAESEPGSGQRDLAVTLRWQLRGSSLVQSDRWVDPGDVLNVDE